MRGSLQRGVFIGGCEVFQVLHVVVLKEPRWQFSRQFVQRYLEKNENPRSLRICFCFLNINGILKGEKKSARISLAIIRIKSPTSTEKARSGYDTQHNVRAGDGKPHSGYDVQNVLAGDIYRIQNVVF